MASGIVKTLSAGAQRRSLGETSKKEKATKKPTRTTVINPTMIEWPDVDEDSSQELLTLVEESMKCLKIPCRHVPLNEIRTVPSSERSDFRKAWISENSIKTGYDISNYTLLRTTVALGVNCVSKSLEMELLAGVIIEKEVDPQIITKLLIPVARSRGVPIISLSGFNKVFKRTTGIRCIALGFKKPCENVTHEFYQLLQAVKEHSAKLTEDECGPDTLCVTINPADKSSSLLSSQEEEDRLPEEVQPAVSPQVPLGPVSIEDEIAKLERKVNNIRKNIHRAGGSGYRLPKIRKVTPK